VHWTSHWAARSAIAVAALLGCGRVADGPTRNAGPDSGRGGADGSLDGPNTFVDTISQKSVDKIDILFMIQNSRSMADKQAVLKDAVPDLVQRLVSPNCVDPTTFVRDPGTPKAPDAPCPGTTIREFNPIRNIHVGVISSSLGGHGSASCRGADGAGLEAEEVDDHGHLVATRPRFATAMQANPGGQPPDPAGFLEWNPDANKGQQVEPFMRTVQAMTTSVGEFGCGLGSPLESIYRFLVDPAPPLSVTTQPCPGSSQPCAEPVGIDSALLAQRKAFLRPDSLVIVVLISDQNDRGVDSLYPTQRYVNAFSKANLCTSRPDLDPYPKNCPDLNGDHQPDVVPNPLFLQGPGGEPRSPSLVYLAGIVGVPWQDLLSVAPWDINIPYPPNELHYMTARQLLDDKKWDLILGDPAASPSRPPKDGLMVESRYPRSGNDVAGRPIAGPLVPVAQNSPINGHEWNNTANDDLMYACIFPLKAPRDCIQVEMAVPAPACDCGNSLKPEDNNPLCQSPDGTYGNIQYFAKAYPGLRELTVLRDLGDSAIVASICARNIVDTAAQDYGYRPALDAIVDRLKGSLTGRCLPPKLSPNQAGKIPCSIIEVRPKATGGTGCDATKGRLNPDATAIGPALERLKAKEICDSTGAPACSTFQLCEITPLNNRAEDQSQACHKDGIFQPQAGWCYVDPESNPIDDPSLVAKCQASEQRIIRFVDPANATPANGATVIIACSVTK
jgi:hypothetical protein